MCDVASSGTHHYCYSATIVIPYPHQLELANEGYEILKKHMIVYLATEERTGKTLASILIAEMCDNVDRVLVLTKKKAVQDWKDTLVQFPHDKKYTVTNYHQCRKMARPNLLILDESHNYISGCPDQPSMQKYIKENISMGIPIIYLSATPHAQGYQMLYHQLALSTWSPWHRYKNFRHWFAKYGIPSTVWVNSRERAVYTKTHEDLVLPNVQHLFITRTRKELNFPHEPVDQLHYIELDESTKEIYNELLKDKMYEFGENALICDSPMKLRTSLHMLEGGVAKIDTQYFHFANCEKILYILETWGDTEDLVIYYQYIAEGRKLRRIFKKATILQGTSNAEGIDLAHKETIVIYSQDFSTARHSQRRARQAAKHRDKPITVHFLLVKKATSAQVYRTVSINKQNFVDSVFERTLL
jgi:hypothetical protein